ncbi:hypothetical protein C8T65DRAFT_832771 [Cerioporus squamosus]|nr:hypothetical protein C8T65DRAFT_832771 [Cerioporus squamosus]
MLYCLPSSDFLEAFLPLPPESHRKPKPARITFDAVVGFTSEKDLAERWVAVVNKVRSLCRGYVVCLETQDCWDPTDSNLKKPKVDAAFYSRRKHPIDGRPHWGRQRALVEFKAGGAENDPFTDISGDKQARTHTEICRKLASYTAYAFARQQRTAIFTFLVNGTEARVLRWERAGTIFTEAFDYVQDPDLLCEFLWRFFMLSGADQGLDPTATPLGKRHKWYRLMSCIAEGPLEGQPEDICGDEGTAVPSPADCSTGLRSAPVQGAFKYVREKFAASIAGDAPRYRIAVPTDRPGQFKYFLIGNPMFEAPDMLSRGTRGYIAVDVHTKRFVWLKDTWRHYNVNVDSEGKILEQLHEANVSRIPALVCAGDLRQETQMHYHWKSECEVQDPEEPGEGSRGSKRNRSGTTTSTGVDTKRRKQPRIRHLSHYRLVVSEVCLPLTEFKTPRQLIQVVLDCVEAHEDAVTNAKLVHGDISISNVLILPTLVKNDGQYKVEWRGILADWELTNPIPEDGQPHRARQSERAGTWQFKSAALLYWVRLHVAVEDELESFFSVVLYAGVRFLRSNVPDARSFLRSFFDSYELVKNEYRCGLTKMAAMQSGFLSTAGGPIQFIRSDGEDGHPLNTILADMLPLFRARYAEITYDRAQVAWRKHNKYKTKSSSKARRPSPLAQSVVGSAARVKTHAYFKALLQGMLERDDWPTEDYVGDLLTGQNGLRSSSGDEASDDESLSDYGPNGDASPVAKRKKANREDELAAIYGSD